MMTEDGRDRCGAEKDDGEPCPNPIGLCGNCGRCKGHCAYDPDCKYDEEEVQASRSKGGRRRGEQQREGKIRTVPDDEAPPPPESLEDAVHWASWATWAVATGKIDGRTAHEVGYLVRAYMKGLGSVEDLEERMERLEDALAEAKRGNLEALE